MAKRVSTVGVNVEYVPTTGVRVSTVGVNIEQIDAVNYLRISALCIMVEYIPITSTGRTQGPAVQ